MNVCLQQNCCFYHCNSCFFRLDWLYAKANCGFSLAIRHRIFHIYYINWTKAINSHSRNYSSLIHIEITYYFILNAFWRLLCILDEKTVFVHFFVKLIWIMQIKWPSCVDSLAAVKSIEKMRMKKNLPRTNAIHMYFFKEKSKENTNCLQYWVLFGLWSQNKYAKAKQIVLFFSIGKSV